MRTRGDLTEAALVGLEADFAARGRDAIRTLRELDPATYVRLVAACIPKDNQGDDNQ